MYVALPIEIHVGPTHILSGPFEMDYLFDEYIFNRLIVVAGILWQSN